MWSLPGLQRSLGSCVGVFLKDKEMGTLKKKLTLEASE